MARAKASPRMMFTSEAAQKIIGKRCGKKGSCTSLLSTPVLMMHTIDIHFEVPNCWIFSDFWTKTMMDALIIKNFVTPCSIWASVCLVRGVYSSLFVCSNVSTFTVQLRPHILYQQFSYHWHLATIQWFYFGRHRRGVPRGHKDTEAGESEATGQFYASRRSVPCPHPEDDPRSSISEVPGHQGAYTFEK